MSSHPRQQELHIHSRGKLWYCEDVARNSAPRTWIHFGLVRPFKRTAMQRVHERLVQNTAIPTITVHLEVSSSLLWCSEPS